MYGYGQPCLCVSSQIDPWTVRAGAAKKVFRLPTSFKPQGSRSTEGLPGFFSVHSFAQPVSGLTATFGLQLGII